MYTRSFVATCLRGVRTWRGFSQKDLAKLCNIQLTQMTRHESGGYDIYIGTLQHLLATQGLSLDVFFNMLREIADVAAKRRPVHLVALVEEWLVHNVGAAATAPVQVFIPEPSTRPTEGVAAAVLEAIGAGESRPSICVRMGVSHQYVSQLVGRAPSV